MFPTRIVTPTAIIAACCMLGSSLALAADATDAAPQIRSCSRLSAKEKATCEWENHKAYKALAKLQPAEPPAPEPVSNFAASLILPSCSRKSGKEKAACEWENHKAMKNALHGNTGSSASAASAASRGSVAPSPSAPCKTLKGRAKAQCVLEVRKAARGG